jgi:hypothetical protein
LPACLSAHGASASVGRPGSQKERGAEGAKKDFAVHGR